MILPPHLQRRRPPHLHTLQRSGSSGNSSGGSYGCMGSYGGPYGNGINGAPVSARPPAYPPRPFIHGHRPGHFPSQARARARAPYSYHQPTPAGAFRYGQQDWQARGKGYSSSRSSRGDHQYQERAAGGAPGNTRYGGGPYGAQRRYGPRSGPQGQGVYGAPARGGPPPRPAYGAPLVSYPATSYPAADPTMSPRDLLLQAKQLVAAREAAQDTSGPGGGSQLPPPPSTFYSPGPRLSLGDGVPQPSPSRQFHQQEPHIGPSSRRPHHAGARPTAPPPALYPTGPPPPSEYVGQGGGALYPSQRPRGRMGR